MKITIQVMKPVYTYEDLDTALHIAEAALKRGHEVRLFLFSDAVIGANKSIKPIKIDRVIPEKIKALIEKGLRVDLCGICMDYRGLSADSVVEGASSSGLPELAELIATSDVFINFMAQEADIKRVLFVAYQAPVGSIWVNEAFRTTFGMYAEDIEPAILLMDEAVTAIAKRNAPERVGLLPVKIVKKYIEKYGTEVYAVEEDLEKFHVKDIDEECKAQIIPLHRAKEIVRECDFVIFM